MKVLVIGSGGREHALAWRLSLGDRVSKVYVAPGNAGTFAEKSIENVNIHPNDIRSLADFAKSHGVDYTVVGGESPLDKGIVDLFLEEGLFILGPIKDLARLETSKSFAKSFMSRHSIPTSPYKCFDNAEEAHNYINQLSCDFVIKSDGLAAGKGVFLPDSKEDGHKIVDALITELVLGEAGSSIIIEERISGDELSFIILTDGKSIETLATSQDYKRLQTGDLGPNTGGMGANSPAMLMTPELHARIMREIVDPTMSGISRDYGMSYRGFLYFGIMVNDRGDPFLLEYNCRLGDPETQVLVMRLASDLNEIFFSAVHRKMDSISCIEWDTRHAVVVILASEGYPSNPIVGRPVLSLPKDMPSFKVFHSGTRHEKGNVLTSGGRVFCVTALGETVRMAQKNAYDMISDISFTGMQYRSDIGYKGIKDHY
ncbi:phosphoribosylamine--glycine ligase [Candidatus Ichthyocystis hellenicum]|uniref:phosphoribosylamine--glycine ligase n=1 Tax=Candidatus Ichthyocystis hellenicum TaxID=1561003 RepID=UPI000B179B51|nr:phosphoribosylamine--glycine ligase [Candidatus Ichthyocystis hellenicum]